MFQSLLSIGVVFADFVYYIWSEWITVLARRLGIIQVLSIYLLIYVVGKAAIEETMKAGLENLRGKGNEHGVYIARLFDVVTKPLQALVRIVLQSVIGFINESFEAVGTAINTATSVFRNSLDTMLEGVRESVKKITAAAETTIEGAKETLEVAKIALQETVAFAESLYSEIKISLSGVPAQISGQLSAFVDSLSEEVQSAFIDLSQMIDDRVAWVGDRATDTTGKLQELATTGVQKVGDKGKETLERVEDRVEDGVDELEEFGKQQLQLIRKAADAEMERAKDKLKRVFSL